MTKKDSTPRWERSILSLPETFQGVEFRHEIPFVSVSSVAEQYYCELKVDHEYTQGVIETEAKQEGTTLHEQLLEVKKTTQTQLIEEVKDRPVCIASFLIGAKVGGVTLAGIPDAIVFQYGKPTFVIELKTAKGPLVLWRDQEVQAKMYALLLESMGFDCSALQIVVAKIRRGIELEEEPKKEFLAVLIKALLDRADARKALRAALRGEAEIFTFLHDKESILRELDWAKQYWLGKRDPIPTNSPGRCRACEFSATCPASLA